MRAAKATRWSYVCVLMMDSRLCLCWLISLEGDYRYCRMHGWSSILPLSFCDRYSVFNHSCVSSLRHSKSHCARDQAILGI